MDYLLDALSEGSITPRQMLLVAHVDRHVNPWWTRHERAMQETYSGCEPPKDAWFRVSTLCTMLGVSRKSLIEILHGDATDGSGNRTVGLLDPGRKPRLLEGVKDGELWKLRTRRRPGKDGKPHFRIPGDVLRMFERGELKPMEALVLSRIRAFRTSGLCYLTNGELGKRFGIGAQRASKIVATLKARSWSSTNTETWCEVALRYLSYYVLGTFVLCTRPVALPFVPRKRLRRGKRRKQHKAVPLEPARGFHPLRRWEAVDLMTIEANRRSGKPPRRSARHEGPVGRMEDGTFDEKGPNREGGRAMLKIPKKQKPTDGDKVAKALGEIGLTNIHCDGALNQVNLADATSEVARAVRSAYSTGWEKDDEPQNIVQGLCLVAKAIDNLAATIDKFRPRPPLFEATGTPEN